MNEPVVLLVEDDVALLEGMSDTLEMVGYRTVKATNGREGLEALAKHSPDLIISDIMMPEMDGYAFHEAVSAQPETAAIPFIFLTARSDQADVRRGLREGVDAYLTKPFDLEDLLLHVQNRLSRFAAIRKQLMSRLEELQNQIVTMFSHEFRTPLTYIQGYTDLLAESSEPTKPDEIRLFLEGIQAGSRRLNRLLENLLALVHLDTQTYVREYERFADTEPDLGWFAELVGAIHQSAAAKKGLEIRVEAPERPHPVRVVREQIIRVVDNLVENAVKFTPPGRGPVVLRTYRSGEHVCLEVKDPGIGVAVADMPYLFERFRQINRARLEQPGLGVGLAIARGLARIHRGDIEVTSELDRGSVFTLWLPAVAALEADVPARRRT